MSEREIGLGRLFVQEAIKAATWGAVFLLVMGMFFTSIKRDIRENIAYGVDRFLMNAVVYAMHPALVGETKQLVKRGINFTLARAAKEARGLMRERAMDSGGSEHK